MSFHLFIVWREIDNLIAELLGNYKLSNTNCMGGSASIYSKINMFGHDGHMGTQVPIGIGACFTSKNLLLFLWETHLQKKIMFWVL